jgi:mannose-1-phosphate guanylyltransferase/mannose-1-phosphate guanylyltransferase/mannose-6-phosphate isomerase
MLPDEEETVTEHAKIVPVILSGGAGTRLWPMSRPERPKQFLPLTSDATMFAETLSRTADTSRFSAPIIVANGRHRDLIEADLGDAPATIILEPAARNTAPAIALAALAAAPDAPLLVMPSDHVISDVPAFHDAIARGLPFALDGWLVTFGIAPTGPETGYGYIRFGETQADGVHAVSRFIEKPDIDRAKAMLAEGGHSWNGGIFLFRADAYLSALERNAPAMLTAARAAMAGASQDGQAVLPDQDAFAASPSDSIDYAVMEKSDRVAVIPVSMGWSDIGSWDSLYDNRPRDDRGTASAGNVIALDTDNCLIESDGLQIATVGVSDLIVIASGNKVLIMPRGTSQRVRDVVDAAAKKGD